MVLIPSIPLSIPRNGRPARNWLVADRILKDQFLFLRVCEQNRARFGSHFFQCNTQGCFHKLIQIERLKEGLADPFDRLQLRLIVEKL